jgi:hypothetical protein
VITITKPEEELAGALRDLARRGKSPMKQLEGCVPPCLEIVELMDLPLPGTYYWKLELPYPTGETWLVCRPNMR